MEQEVMKVLWESQHELTNSEIAESMKDQKVSVASVAQTMKRLLEKGAVCEEIMSLCQMYMQEHFIHA